MYDFLINTLFCDGLFTIDDPSSITDVYKAVYVPNNMLVAAKTLKDENRATQQFLAEASVMTQVTFLCDNIFMVYNN